MNILSVIMLVFSMLGSVDRLTGNHLGLGKEFEKGFGMLGSMALSMLGMLVLGTLISRSLTPAAALVNSIPGIDASIVPSSLLANDMGGAQLSLRLGENEQLSELNAFVVSSMMGCTVSYSIPLAMQILKKEKQNAFFFGTLCGIVTIPLGCFTGGLLLGIPVLPLVLNLLPLVVFSLLVALGILRIPQITVKIFTGIGIVIRTLIAVGLAAGILKFMTGSALFDIFDDISEGGLICMNAAITLSGAFPFMYVVSKLIKPALKKASKLLDIEETASMGFVSSLITNLTTIESMNGMGDKGIVLNAAFSVSASFVLAAHLAYTMAFRPDLVGVVVISKLIAGISGLAAAILLYPIYKRSQNNNGNDEQRETK